jgi:antitoxin component of RelBE/YafQ-DinJ toxin-antitoxin module
MASTSLRLPESVRDALRRDAERQGLGYAAYVRAILERVAQQGAAPNLRQIDERLARIEQALNQRGYGR